MSLKERTSAIKMISGRRKGRGEAEAEGQVQDRQAGQRGRGERGRGRRLRAGKEEGRRGGGSCST